MNARFLRSSAIDVLPAACLVAESMPDWAFATYCGAALWLPPGVHPDGEALEKVFRDTAKPEHLDDLLATSVAPTARRRRGA